jgi:hypothetical protein
MEYLGLIQLLVDLVRVALQGGQGAADAETRAVYRLIRAAQDTHAARRFGNADP